jgi:large subunit ribosomal protein L24
MKKLKSWDPIMVIAWKYKGKVSSIEKLDENSVWVKEVNEVKRATKWKGFVKKHLPIHVSNVMYYDEASKKPSKVKIAVNKEGKRIRKIAKTDKEIK